MFIIIIGIVWLILLFKSNDSPGFALVFSLPACATLRFLTPNGTWLSCFTGPPAKQISVYVYAFFFISFSCSEHWCGLTITTTTSTSMTYFPITLLLGTHEDSIYTTKERSNASQTIAASGLSDWISICLSGHLCLYFTQDILIPGVNRVYHSSAHPTLLLSSQSLLATNHASAQLLLIT